VIHNSLMTAGITFTGSRPTEGWAVSTCKRINDLIKAIQRDPFQGIGKPEPLRHALAGYSSRRINDEHRIVYKVRCYILIAQARHHYGWEPR